MSKLKQHEVIGCTDEEIIVCLKDISVAYGKYLALYRINIDISKGEFIGIIGPNGSGKTTLLKTILGLIKPLEGQLSLYGKPIRGHIPKDMEHRIGYVPQFANFDRNFPALVKDIAMMGRYGHIGILGFRKTEDYEAVEKALTLVGMERMKERPIGHLSGGQQQKVMIAQALASKPDVLLLDEPTASLDFKMTRDVMEVLKDLNKRHGITILSINHNIKLIKEFTDRVIAINRYLIYADSPHLKEFDEAINRAFYN